MGARPQRGARIADPALEAVGLDAMCGLVPDVPSTRVLWERSERDRQVGRRRRFEGGPSLLLTEYGELVSIAAARARQAARSAC